MRATCAVRLTRYYAAAPEEVWAAMTEPESLARWLAPPREVNVKVGGSLVLGLDGARPLTARVLAVDPGRLLELAWAPPGEEPSTVRFEVARDGAGTLLVLDHRRLDAALGMRYIARWDSRLARLDNVVETSGATP